MTIKPWDLDRRMPPTEKLDRWVLDSPALGTLDHMTVGLSRVAPGEQSPRHAPPVDELWYVVRGHGLAVIGDQEIELHPGVGFSVKADVMQHSVNTGDGPLDILWVYAPAGAEDLLRDPPPAQWPRQGG